MSKPVIKSGRFHAGADLRCGENVVIDVAEEMVVGDRVVLPDNAYFEGRRVTIADDFYGYSWEHPGFPRHDVIHGGVFTGLGPPVGRWLEVGRGRKDDEHATLTVGSRSTFHDNRIDLAAPVVIGDDVGLSPEVCIYTHYYWQSVLDGFPCRTCQVWIGRGTLIGFRSVLLPGVEVPDYSVVGAGSVVSGKLTHEHAVYAGNPARLIRRVEKPTVMEQHGLLVGLCEEYLKSRRYRGLDTDKGRIPHWTLGERFGWEFAGCRINPANATLEGEENEDTDDIRWFLFTRGIRIYTRRLFRKLGRKA